MSFVGEARAIVDEEINLNYLEPLLDCMQEGAEICDNSGNVVFVNQAFTKNTGVKAEDWVGSNLFELAPQGPLVQALVSRQPIIWQRTVVQGLEVIANALPVFIDGQLAGGIMTWVPSTDSIRIKEDLMQCQVLIENLYARVQQLSGARCTFENILGNSRATRLTVEAARKVAKTDNPVLILGECGSGKELFAQAIHQTSRRRDKPFIKLNTNSLPDSLLEDELFGHDKGACNGVTKTKIGCFELANGGTLFIEEIGNLNLFMQDKLLRVLEHWEFFRVGGSMPLRVDVRIIAASNRDLRVMLQEGKLREQLYYWLNSFELHIPTLRQRREDIPQLVNYLIGRNNRELGKNVKGITSQALQILVGYEWPGNVRELEHVIERAMVSTAEPQLSQKHIADYLSSISGGLMQVHDIMPLERMEEILLRAALARFGESLEGKKKAALALNISLATLYNKLKKYDI
jgi:transcriptional regulator with PAS, ATPase and Fis domain